MLPIKPDYINDFGGDKKDYTSLVNYLTDRSANEVNLALKTCSNIAKVAPLIQITYSNLFNTYPDVLIYSAFYNYTITNPITLSGTGTFNLNINTQFIR